VGGEVIQDHDISRPQARAQHAANISLYELRVGGPIDGHARRETMQAHHPEDSRGVPRVVGILGVHTLALESVAVRAGQVGLGA